MSTSVYVFYHGSVCSACICKYILCVCTVYILAVSVCVYVCVLTTCLHDVRRLVGMLDEVREKVVYGGEIGTYNVCILYESLSFGPESVCVCGFPIKSGQNSV